MPVPYEFDWHAFVRDAARAPLSSQRRVLRVDELALRPPQRMPRRVDTPWSACTMSASGGSGGRRVAVPKAAIARMRPCFEAPPFGSCAHAHGWALPDARSIVVLRIHAPLLAGAALYGWFVRYESDPTHLVRVPAGIVRLFIAHHWPDAGTAHSVAEADLLLCRPQDGVDFCQRAAEQFTRQRARIAESFGASKALRDQSKRKRADDGAPSETSSSSTRTCCVCLEQSAAATARCARGTCQAAICAGCHDSLRGLCPICNRGANDALFECASCTRAQPLRRSGHPCLGCNSNTLCRTCYKAFASCSECTA